MTLNLKFVLGIVENIAGKGENAGCQHFLPMFFKVFFPCAVKTGDCVVKSQTTTWTFWCKHSAVVPIRNIFSLKM